MGVELIMALAVITFLILIALEVPIALAIAGGGLLGLWVAVQVLMVIRLVSLVVRVRGDAWTRSGAALVGEA
jgi:hypothetical protein